MCRFFIPVTALVLSAALASAQPPAFRIEAADHQKVRATITYELRTTKFAATKWMIFVPEPPELPSQQKVKTTASPTGKVVVEKSPPGRKLRYIEIAVAKPTPGAGVTVKLEVDAVLRSRQLVELKAGEKPPVVDPLTANERKYVPVPDAAPGLRGEAVPGVAGREEAPPGQGRKSAGFRRPASWR